MNQVLFFVLSYCIVFCALSRSALADEQKQENVFEIMALLPSEAGRTLFFLSYQEFKTNLKRGVYSRLTSRQISFLENLFKEARIQKRALLAIRETSFSQKMLEELKALNSDPRKFFRDKTLSIFDGMGAYDKSVSDSLLMIKFGDFFAWEDLQLAKKRMVKNPASFELKARQAKAFKSLDELLGKNGGTRAGSHRYAPPGYEYDPHAHKRKWTADGERFFVAEDLSELFWSEDPQSRRFVFLIRKRLSFEVKTLESKNATLKQQFFWKLSIGYSIWQKFKDFYDRLDFRTYLTSQSFVSAWEHLLLPYFGGAEHAAAFYQSFFPKIENHSFANSFSMRIGVLSESDVSVSGRFANIKRGIEHLEEFWPTFEELPGYRGREYRAAVVERISDELTRLARDSGKRGEALELLNRMEKLLKENYPNLASPDFRTQPSVAFVRLAKKRIKKDAPILERLSISVSECVLSFSL